MSAMHEGVMTTSAEMMYLVRTARHSDTPPPMEQKEGRKKRKKKEVPSIELANFDWIV